MKKTNLAAISSLMNLLVVKKIILTFLLVIVFTCLIPSTSLAATLGEEFATKDNIQTGSIVSLDTTSNREIRLSTIENSNFTLGVAVDSNATSLNFEKQNSTLSVAFNGEVQVFVSDVNGEIKKGDSVTASWLEGVGMKLSESENQKILGVALEDYSSQDAKAYGAVSTPTGEKNIKIDTIKLRLFGEKNYLANSSQTGSSIQQFLFRITGNEVSNSRFFLGSLLFTLSVAVAAIFIYSAIKSSFISIGRNPLSSGTIYKSLVNVSVMAVSIIVIGAALSYVVWVM